ncbi:hypothetical protein BTA31_15330 [Bacillus haynesii]|uniref:Uncharacterized protein n=1 Tax=Bacillus haynesii TaxID=1925021 RepID=A0ABX3I4U2_9BACI|nr:hypothetical protein [Bacillus haynesii]OMI26193.1 hypothetical protein BTA31_15330 [Bacillus haynesii]
MKKFLFNFLVGLLNKFAISIILNLASPLIVLISSKIRTGDWFSLFFHPVIDCLLGLLFVWLVTCIIYKIITLRKNNMSTPIVFEYGGEEIALYIYNDVLWLIRGNRDYMGNVKVGSLYADTPPRCPKCEMELEENKKLLGSYKWLCIDCGYKKISKNNFIFEATRAAKFARRDAERELKNNEREG